MEVIRLSEKFADSLELTILLHLGFITPKQSLSN